MSSSLLGGEAGLGLVLVEFEFEYQGRDGALVSIKPNERYILLDKTNDHWWQVRKDQRHKPFYIPAKYVKELPTSLPSLLDFTHPPTLDMPPLLPPLATTPKPIPVPVPKTSEELVGGRTKPGDEVTIRLRPDSTAHRRTENRMSTFGVLLDSNDPPPSRWVADVPLDVPGDSESKTGSEGTTNMVDSSLGRKRQSVLGSVGKSVSLDEPGGAADPIPPHRPHTQPIPVETPTVPSMGAGTKQADSPRASSQHQESHEEEEEEEVAEEEFSEEEEKDCCKEEDSHHIYESIQDLNLDLDSLRTSETPHSQDQNAVDGDLPVYANVSTLKKMSAPQLSVSTSSPTLDPAPSVQEPTHSSLGQALPSSASSSGMLSPASPPSSQDGWQVHTDKDSGKVFYYHPASGETTWSDPRNPSTPSAGDNMETAKGRKELQASPSPVLSPASSQGSCGWEQLLDEATGRPYYYNPRSGATSWESPEPLSASSLNSRAAHSPTPQEPEDRPPPLPKEDYPTEEENSPHTFSTDAQPQQGKHTGLIPRAQLDSSLPSIPSILTTPAGWTCSKDADGKTVYTSPHSQEQWVRCEDDRGKFYFYMRDGTKSQWTLPKLPSAPGSLQPQRLMGNGVDPEGITVQVKGWRHSMAPPPDDNLTDGERGRERCDLSHRRSGSDHSDTSSTGTAHHTSPPSHLLEKAGILNKTKVADNGKRIRKNWSQSWTVLHGGVLTFHKDPKTAPSSTSSKTTQIVPEYTVDLRGSSLTWASKDKSSKKNVLELRTRHGCEYLVQYDTESIISDWHKVILDTIRQLDQDQSEESDDGQSDKEDREKKRSTTRGHCGSADPDQGRVRTKLRKFLQRRPTLQSVKDKGYIRDNVFGCHLDTLCHRENTTVPKFVEKCIRSVERRGLDVDGIYRVSGNLAVIQKLRHKADHEEELDLEDGQWDEIHVITGALKLFFRELPEPLFPFHTFTKFITAIKIPDYNQRVSYIKDLVLLLPLPNHDTMEVLFKHLRRVIEHGESNRMSVQSVAIVFGPTLLRPQTESANFTVHMVFQSQIVELILNEFHTVFPGR